MCPLNNRLILKWRKFCCCNSQIILNTKNKCDVRCGMKILWAKLGENWTTFVYREQFSSKSKLTDGRHGDTIMLCKPEGIFTVQKHDFKPIYKNITTPKQLICVHMKKCYEDTSLFAVDSWLCKSFTNFVLCKVWRSPLAKCSKDMHKLTAKTSCTVNVRQVRLRL